MLIAKNNMICYTITALPIFCCFLCEISYICICKISFKVFQLQPFFKNQNSMHLGIYIKVLNLLTTSLNKEYFIP